MRRGPKGASIETQLEVTATRTWKFPLSVLIARLGLPDDARLQFATMKDDDAGARVVSVTEEFPLVAVATETRKPAVKP